MRKSKAPYNQATRDDRILIFTRVISIIVIPFLLLAFIILYIFPDQTDQRWAWEIQPPMTALFVGSGYLGGAYFFLNVISSHRWHRVAIGFPAIAVFTLSMLLLTLLHWELFDTHRPAFQLPNTLPCPSKWLFCITRFILFVQDPEHTVTTQ